MADRTGQQLGNYRLVALLGQGGYAEVYLGQHVRFNQQAAIKVLHAHLSSQEAEHFQHEAETIAQLAHPAIVRVFDFDVQDGVPFLVMDYAPNGSLRRRYPKGSLVPLPQIVSSVKQVASALQYAHEQKFMHRDVKPENMLLGRQQEVLLSDFGLAALAHSTASLSPQETIGTLAYMAPEQIEGHPRAASDQYALGVVVYEWLCGERPFEGSITEVMVKHLSMPPPPLRERVPAIPPEVEQVVLRALAKDPKARFPSVQDFASTLEQASQRALSPTAQLASEQPALSPAAISYDTVAVASGHPVLPAEAASSAELPAGALEPTVYPGSSAPHGLDTPQSGAAASRPQRGQPLEPTVAATPAPAEVPLLPTPPSTRQRRRVVRSTAALLIGLVVLVVAGGILSSVSLLAHFGVGGKANPPIATPVRGGTWTDDFFREPDSLIPNASHESTPPAPMVDMALYLPLFYSDAQGAIHPGAATEIPTIQNRGISADATTWTFHLRPNLVWSDGQPYDARDVDFTWKLWLNPAFVATFTYGYNLITRAEVSADHLSITFHLKRPFVPFPSYWVDGFAAPLPMHHFSSMAPQAIYRSPDNLNPRVTSGPFMMSESVPGDHYTLVRNPRYYLAGQGLPHLDKLVIRIAPNADALLMDLQAGTITSSYNPDFSRVPEFRRFTSYILSASPTIAYYEGLYFNFHNVVLTHLEVRQAIAMAIDQQALIATALHGFGEPLCTDHPSAFHPGYQPDADCPPFDPSAANKLLDDNGWMKSPDRVRTKNGQRLEFELSSITDEPWRVDIEAIVQRNLSAIGIKLDIQNYPAYPTFFQSFLPGGKASPPSGAVAGRFDIAEYPNGFTYDPDDSTLLACDQIPPNGGNITFYCNRALDALYQQELSTADPGVRQEIFDQIHHIYLTDYPFIVLSGEKILAIVRKGTHNYQPSPFGIETINVWQWWCDGGKC